MTMTTSVDPKVMDGKATAKALQEELKQELETIKNSGAQSLPKLVVILVGDDPASQVYVNKKAKTAHKIGMLSEVILLAGDTKQDRLLHEIDRLNNNPAVHGILVQLPLPKQINEDEIIKAIDPKKDVDGFHPVNVGKLALGHDVISKPCTPAGVMTLLEKYNVDLAGKHAVIVGRSNIVGKPMSLMLLHENATVTLCHSHSNPLCDFTKEADIVVAAVGIPNLIQPEHIKEGAVVIDVGINRLEGEDGKSKLVGDVDYQACKDKASLITPVPGGVGPMTIATLMQNTLALYKKYAG